MPPTPLTLLQFGRVVPFPHSRTATTKRPSSAGRANLVKRYNKKVESSAPSFSSCLSRPALPSWPTRPLGLHCCQGRGNKKQDDDLGGSGRTKKTPAVAVRWRRKWEISYSESGNVLIPGEQRLKVDNAAYPPAEFYTMGRERDKKGKEE